MEEPQRVPKQTRTKMPIFVFFELAILRTIRLIPPLGFAEWGSKSDPYFYSHLRLSAFDRMQDDCVWEFQIEFRRS